MAYHARPCQFVTLSPLLLCIIHGYPPLGPVSLSSLSLLFVSPSAFLSFLFPSLYFLLLLLFLTPFLRVSVLPFQFVSFSSIFPGPSHSCRLTRRTMFLSRPSLSFCLSAMRWRRMGKAHRHHAISFIAADPPRIQIVVELTI